MAGYDTAAMDDDERQRALLEQFVGELRGPESGMDFSAEMAEEPAPQGMDFSAEVASAPMAPDPLDALPRPGMDVSAQMADDSVDPANPVRSVVRPDADQNARRMQRAEVQRMVDQERAQEASIPDNPYMPDPPPAAVSADQRLTEADRPQPGSPGGPPVQAPTQTDATTADMARHKEEAPGALPTDERAMVDARTQRDKQAQAALDNVGEIRRDPNERSQGLQRTQRATMALGAIQSLMGMVGGAMSASPDEAMQRAGMGMNLAGGSIPVGMPGSIYRGREAEAERDRGAAREHAASLNAREQALNQRSAMDTAARRTDLSEEAQDYEIGAHREARGAANRLGKQDSEESMEARRLLGVMASELGEEQFPNVPRERLQELLASGTAEQINPILQGATGAAFSQGRRQRGGGGGTGTGTRTGDVPAFDAPFNAREQGLIEEWVRLELGGRDEAEQRIRDARSAGAGGKFHRYDDKLQQFEQSFEAGRTRFEPMRREDNELRNNQVRIENALAAVGTLSDEQLRWIQASEAIQQQFGDNLAARTVAQATLDRTYGLSEEQMEAARVGRSKFARLAEMFARAESGAAINAAEWIRFYQNIGADWASQTPDTMRARLQELSEEHQNRYTQFRQNNPLPGSNETRDGGGEAVQVVVETEDGITVVGEAPRNSPAYNAMVEQAQSQGGRVAVRQIRGG